MNNMIDKHKLTVNRFTAELEEELDAGLRCFVLTEVEVYETAMRDNGDGTFDRILKSKVVGATEVKQGDKTVKGKSKRRHSQRLRGTLYYKAEEDGLEIDEEYEKFMNWLIANSGTVWGMYKQSKV
jgi:hypothetical protein